MPRPVRLSSRGVLFDIRSYARAGADRDRFFSPAQIAQIARTVRHAPEAVVKVSGGGKNRGAVAAHFRYLSRGEFELETDDGERVKGSGRAVIEEWGLEFDCIESSDPYRGISGRKSGRLVHNLVFSMPRGTPAEPLFQATRDFAREEFALKHRYAMVLHTDEPHPHVHLVVKAVSEQGQRLNIKKATLREWRQQFARHLRARGIRANATDRAVRGTARPRKLDGIYRAMRDGRSSHIQARIESVAAELRREGTLKVQVGKDRLLQTRSKVEEGWRGVSEVLRRMGHSELAAEVDRFVERMPRPKTEREWLAQGLIEARKVRERVHEPRAR